MSTKSSSHHDILKIGMIVDNGVLVDYIVVIKSRPASLNFQFVESRNVPD